MRPLLLHSDRDLDLGAELPPNADALARDLGLDALWSAMAGDDPFALEVAQKVLLAGLDDPGEIAYRQGVLADCIAHPEVARELYALATEALEAKRRAYGFLSDSPDAILSRSVQALEYLLGSLRQLRGLADRHAPQVRSAGFRRLFASLAAELDDGYLARVEGHLEALRFRRGILMDARLGPGNRGAGYVLQRPRERRWHERLAEALRRPNMSFEIPPRDEAGSRALAELRGRGINLVANALAQATDHVLSFFAGLRAELAFYIGCVNLHDRLALKAEPVAFPVPVPAGERALSARGLYNPCLSLQLEGRTVGNDLGADGKALVMITGANQGGKSTFLRAMGLAQLMMQSGMFVAARALTASVCTGVFTHFKREEDAAMRRGKLDEELVRMSELAELVEPGALVLLNESFASTNEREGSEIGRQVVRALTGSGVRVVYVTHLYDLAHGLHAARLPGALFLRAERLAGGQRTFRLAEGEPLPTSYGADAFRRVFGSEPERRPEALAPAR